MRNFLVAHPPCPAALCRQGSHGIARAGCGLAAVGMLLCCVSARGAEEPRRPNVVLIMTDDQGYGDLGLHGNPIVRTPNLDRLGREGVQLTQFQVSPVCTPTRASLMTGRYNFRTRAIDTYLGRAMMDTAEVTTAELLRAAGYRTGIFGKWHLGDNFPMRPQDQGFERTLIHRGGGIAQPSDPPVPGGGSYHDPVLFDQGQAKRFTGYCSDVYVTESLKWIDAAGDQPFFLYLPFNAPHGPLQVPAAEYEHYRKLDLAAGKFPAAGQPFDKGYDFDTTARIYAMVENIDTNVGRLLKHLDDRKLTDDTLVIFLTDNGPQQARYNAGMRGRKASVYQGGIRVPCFVKYPKAGIGGRTNDRIAAHIDLAPTILDFCNVKPPAELHMDGVSLRDSLVAPAAGAPRSPVVPERTLYAQWHRGDAPEARRAFAARTQRWKLVRPEGSAKNLPAFELYDIQADPFETKSVADEHPKVVAEMLAGYDRWFADVSATRGYAAPRIVVGDPAENPSELTRQDWRGGRAGWGKQDRGHWELNFAAAGKYEFRLRFPGPANAVTLRVGTQTRHAEVPAGATDTVLGPFEIPAGPADLEASIGAGPEALGPHYVEVRKLP